MADFFFCTVHCHGVELSSFDNGDLALVLWEPAQSHGWGRIHNAWEALRQRHSVGAGEVILTKADVEQVRDLLTEHLLKDWDA